MMMMLMLLLLPMMMMVVMMITVIHICDDGYIQHFYINNGIKDVRFVLFIKKSQAYLSFKTFVSFQIDVTQFLTVLKKPPEAAKYISTFNFQG